MTSFVMFYMCISDFTSDHLTTYGLFGFIYIYIYKSKKRKEKKKVYLAKKLLGGKACGIYFIWV